MTVIEVEGLHKRYGEVHALRGVSFAVELGEVYALLGPNGAGKSTTVEILEGHRTRTDGRIEVLGVDPAQGGRAFRDRIGIVLQRAGIEPELTVREAVTLYAGTYRTPRPIDEVIELVGLADKADARIGTLSGGQQRRIDLGLGLIGDPDLVFLDEPTTGFDPSARRSSWELIEALTALGTTVLLTTHYMEEAQYLADRVGIIVDGRIIAEGTPDELIGGQSTTTVRFRVDGHVELDALPVAATRSGDGEVVVEAERPTAALHALTGWAIDNDVELFGLEVSTASLEDVYLSLTGSAAAGGDVDGAEAPSS